MSVGIYSHVLEILEHLPGPFMLHSCRKPFYMHWNLPIESPKRPAITSLTVHLARRCLCEWGTWPPPARTQECYSGCEYEIQLLKVECANLSPGLLKVACVNPSRASLNAVCADLRWFAGWWTRLWQTFCVKGEGGVLRRALQGQIERARWHGSALACGALGGCFYFSPYMILHVLFFLGLLWDVQGTELHLLSGSPTAVLLNGHVRLMHLWH